MKIPTHERSVNHTLDHITICCDNDVLLKLLDVILQESIDDNPDWLPVSIIAGEEWYKAVRSIYKNLEGYDERSLHPADGKDYTFHGIPVKLSSKAYAWTLAIDMKWKNSIGY